MITSIFCFWLTHGVCHIQASAGIGAFILVILLAPTRFRCRAATTSARFRHGRGSIDVASKKKHSCMSYVFDSGCIIAIWNQSLIEEYILD